MFKIKNTETGLFSTGGSWPSWSKEGKTWSKRGHVTSHLTQTHDKKMKYTGCVVEEYEMISVGTVWDVLDWAERPSTTRAKELEEQRRLERKVEYKNQKIQDLKEQLYRLKKAI
jgi:hypothetical protein